MNISGVEVHGIEQLSSDEITFEVQRGGKFVRFLYCISVVVVTFKRSEVYFLKLGESAFLRGLRFAALSLLFGWWGFPWGPIYTVEALVTDFRGGEDITPQMWAVSARPQVSVENLTS